MAELYADNANDPNGQKFKTICDVMNFEDENKARTHAMEHPNSDSMLELAVDGWRCE